jgi:Rad3-related DNA helicase
MNHLDLTGYFPLDRYPALLDNQRAAFDFIEGSGERINILECPTGTGKTAIGYSYLRAMQANGAKVLFYLVPNKTLAEQVKSLHPDVHVVYGRNEHPCLFYPKEHLRADEVPCSLLRSCPHRVDQDTGETKEAGAEACPYLMQKYEARRSGGIIVATVAFYLYAVFFAKQFEPEAVVIDEAHGIAKAIRSVLEFHITDWNLARMAGLLHTLGSDHAEALDVFRTRMVTIIRAKESSHKTILEPGEIGELLDLTNAIDVGALATEVRQAIGTGAIDVERDRLALKQLEVLNRDLRMYMRSFEYSLKTDDRNPLNFTFAFWQREVEEGKRVQHELVVKSYYVAPLVRKMLPADVLAYSATIGNPEIFSHETGIKGDFLSLPSTFLAERTRIFMPTDTPNLAVKERNRRDKTKAIRTIAKACRTFADKGIRSLVVVVSNEERQKFLQLAAEERVKALTYGNGMTARECARRFREGEGDVLVGTESNYGEGVDLPKGIAPVIFYYRPSYPRPDDPASIFEERRFGNQRWQVWNWRVILGLLQVRGRNVRSCDDRGVTFLISQQFRRFAFGSLPEWLKPSYVGGKTFEGCVDDAVKMLA